MTFETAILELSLAIGDAKDSNSPKVEISLEAVEAVIDKLVAACFKNQKVCCNLTKKLCGGNHDITDG